MIDSRPIQTPELPPDVRGGCSSPSHCSALRGDWNTHMPCGHLRQFGTLGDVFPVHCLACENVQLRQKLKASKRYLRAAKKGAERNSIVAQLSAARNVKLAEEIAALRKPNEKGQATPPTI